ncbi:hypothetical protein BX616_010646 [Lobosporangium transversale]|nr:hypothetical protein BX616_010646 [Lobosporangium transversale]
MPKQQQQQQQQQRPQEFVVTVPPNQDTNQVSIGSRIKKFFKADDKKNIMLSQRDSDVLAKVKRRAKVLDTGLDLGVAKIGIDPILGLVPVAGDAITMFLALRLIHTAQEADIPKSLTQRMLLNVAIDFGLGLVPVLGDIGDFLFKANDKNAKLFEEFIYERAAKQAAQQAAAAAAVANLAVPAVASQSNTTTTSKGFGFGRSQKPQHTTIPMGTVAAV